MIRVTAGVGIGLPTQVAPTRHARFRRTVILSVEASIIYLIYPARLFVSDGRSSRSKEAARRAGRPVDRSVGD